MHPEFAKKQNTNSFNSKKYVKQWMAIFGLFAIFFFYKDNNLGLIISAVCGAFFLAAYQFIPGLFKTLTLLWLKLGELIGKLMQPIIMGLVFYLFFTPFAWLYRLFGSRDKKGFRKVNLMYSKEDFDQQF